MKWIEVLVKTKKENEDFVSHILYEVGAQGLAIEDPRDVLELANDPESWDFFDLESMDLRDEDVTLKAYYSENADIHNIIQYIKDNIENAGLNNGEGYGRVYLSDVDENDWAEAWKEFYKPTKIGKNILIKPSWEDYKSKADEIVVEMDPGMAFGTGTHETTILCIEGLEDYIKTASKVYDIGCGSGILSIVAAKIGAGEVVGVDIDPNSIIVARENVNRNNVGDIVSICKGNLLDVIKERADMIVSNIMAEVIAGMVEDIYTHLKEMGILITSGIIIDKIDLVKTALEETGFEILEVRTMNEWASIIARRNR